MENQQPQEQAQDAGQAIGLGSPFASRLESLGGPIHPIVMNLPDGGVIHFSGMTARDYYAAHAPSEIPGWFDLADPLELVDEPDIPMRWSALKASPGWEAASDQEKDEAHAALIDLMDGNDVVDSPAAKIARFAHDLIEAGKKANDEAVERNALIQKQNLARRYFAWRRFYAEQMIGLMAQ